MPRDILIVDDEREHLESLASHIRLALNIEPFVSDDPEHALDILKLYPIKVLVADYYMPKITGTQLIRMVREELGLQISCILITGYQEMMKALDVIGLDIDWISKEHTASKLPQAVRWAIQKFDLRRIKESVADVDIIISEGKSSFLKRKQWTLKIKSIRGVIYPFIPEEGWKTDLIAERGIKGTRQITIKRNLVSFCEYGAQAQIINSMGFDLNNVIAKLSSRSDIIHRFSTKASFQKELTVEIKDTIEVKDVSEELYESGPILYSREYQWAPIFVRVNCLLQLDCAVCKIPRLFDISIHLPTGNIARRQREHYDDGTIRERYTGYIS